MSVQRISDDANMYVFSGVVGTNTGGHLMSYSIVTASSHLAVDGHAVFVLALQTGGLLIIKIPPFGSQGECYIF